MRIRLLLRLLLFVGVAFWTVMAVYNKFYISAGIAVVVMILIILELMQYLKRFEQRVQTVLMGVKQGELNFDMLKYVSKKQKEELASVVQKYKESRHDIETDRKMIDELLMNQGVGVIIYSPEGEEVLFNQSAADLLSVPQGVKLDILKNRIQEVQEFLQSDQISCRYVVERNESHILGDTIAIEGTKFHGKRGEYVAFNIQALGDALSKKESEGWLSLVKVLSHEVMNGITPVISLSETLKTTLTANQVNDAIIAGMEAIHTQALSLQKFTDNYRKFTQISRVEKEWVDPNICIQDVIATYQGEFEKNGIQVITRLDFHGKIQLDTIQFRQVLVNMMHNAITALSGVESSRLSIATQRQGDLFELEVFDNGLGIEKDELGKIFIPFYTTKEDGTGIGLSVCRQIVWNHGGQITVDSKVGKHTRFIVNLPVL